MNAIDVTAGLMTFPAPPRPPQWTCPVHGEIGPAHNFTGPDIVKLFAGGESRTFCVRCIMDTLDRVNVCRAVPPA